MKNVNFTDDRDRKTGRSYNSAKLNVRREHYMERYVKIIRAFSM